MLVITPDAYCRQHLKDFHNQRDVLLQFIISDVLLTHKMALSLKLPITDMEAFHEQLTQFSGSLSPPNGYLKLFDWYDGGLLGKIRSYCAHFMDLDKKDPSLNNVVDPLIKIMHELAHVAWRTAHTCCHCTVKKPDKPCDIAFLLKMLRRLAATLERIIKVAFWVVLRRFSDNENVLYFIVERRYEIEALSDHTFTERLFQNLFANGIDDARNFLINRYTLRGFKHYIPIIIENCI